MDKEFWFNKKEKKFLKNIDTLYYAVYFEEDFTKDTISDAVKYLREFTEEIASQEDPVNFYFKTGGTLYYQPGRFSCYSFRLTCADFFDVFVSPEVPTKDTPPMIIQIRSKALWEYGAYKCVADSLEIVEQFSTIIGLHVLEVRENRCDFACHTNYFVHPEKFFREGNFAKMWVGTVGRNYMDKTKEMLCHTSVRDDDSLEKDYIALGKRGDKCFIRLYLKTKEVVQQGYKGFFLMIWKLSGMISNYDFYVLEKAYMLKSWSYVYTARLLWILEHGDIDDDTREKINRTIEAGIYENIRVLADKLTPQITKIYNIEFQVMRDMSKSFKLIMKNEGKYARIYDYLDNYEMIYEYLTRVCLRLVRTDVKDKNKSRIPNIEFWDRLRSAKTVNMKHENRDLKLLREYNSNINAELRKKRAMTALSSYGYAMNLDPNSTLFGDAETLLSTMNDNDMWYLDEHKKKLAMRHAEGIPTNQKRKRCVSYYMFNPETGEFY